MSNSSSPEKVSGEANVKKLVGAVKSSKDNLNWVLFTIEVKKRKKGQSKDNLFKLVEYRSGKGGLPELRHMLKDDSLFVGVLQHKIGETIRTATFWWQGDGVKRIKAAKAQQHRAAVMKELGYASLCNYSVHRTDQLTHETLSDKLKGSAADFHKAAGGKKRALMRRKSMKLERAKLLEKEDSMKLKAKDSANRRASIRRDARRGSQILQETVKSNLIDDSVSLDDLVATYENVKSLLGDNIDEYKDELMGLEDLIQRKRDRDEAIKDLKEALKSDSLDEMRKALMRTKDIVEGGNDLLDKVRKRFDHKSAILSAEGALRSKSLEKMKEALSRARRHLEVNCTLICDLEYEIKKATAFNALQAALDEVSDKSITTKMCEKLRRALSEATHADTRATTKDSIITDALKRLKILDDAVNKLRHASNIRGMNPAKYDLLENAISAARDIGFSASDDLLKRANKRLRDVKNAMSELEDAVKAPDYDRLKRAMQNAANLEFDRQMISLVNAENMFQKIETARHASRSAASAAQCAKCAANDVEKTANEIARRLAASAARIAIEAAERRKIHEHKLLEKLLDGKFDSESVEQPPKVFQVKDGVDDSVVKFSDNTVVKVWKNVDMDAFDEGADLGALKKATVCFDGRVDTTTNRVYLNDLEKLPPGKYVFQISGIPGHDNVQGVWQLPPKESDGALEKFASPHMSQFCRQCSKKRSKMTKATECEHPLAHKFCSAYRFILSWGAVPKDLDLWLMWKTPGRSSFSKCGYSRMRPLYEDNSRTCSCSDHSKCTCFMEAWLDIDKQNGHGPETISMVLLDNVEYHVFVHQYSSDGSIQNSHANVAVHSAIGKVKDMPMHPAKFSGSGRMWHVLSINGKTEALTVHDRLYANWDCKEVRDILK